jgi:hypothetical protein
MVRQRVPPRQALKGPSADKQTCLPVRCGRPAVNSLIPALIEVWRSRTLVTGSTHCQRDCGGNSPHQLDMVQYTVFFTMHCTGYCRECQA